MNCEKQRLARTLSSGLRREISIFRATFRAPRKRFFGPPILHFWALSAVSDEFGHIFRAPENIFRAGIRAPAKGLAEAVLGNPHQKIRGTKNDWSAPGMCRLVLSSIAGENSMASWFGLPYNLPCNNLQIEHASQAPHCIQQVGLQTLGDKIFAPKKTNPSTTDPTPQKFPSETLAPSLQTPHMLALMSKSQ